MSGASQHFALRVQVTSRDGSLYTFQAGAATTGFRPDAEGRTAPIHHAQLRRKIGEPGRLVFALPGRTRGAVGLPWSWVLRANDPVEFEATVQRRGDPNPARGFSHPWRNLFFGFIDTIEEKELFVGDSMQLVTLVTCSDQLGTMAQNHFTYWRRLGESFSGTGPADLIERLKRLEQAGFTESNVTATSIAQGAQILLTAFIYGRIVFQRQVASAKGLEFKDMHAYRLESDDFATSTRLEMLAPDSSSWLESLTSISDAPAFSELFMDSVPEAETARAAPTAANQPGRVDSRNVFTKGAALKLRGGYVELLTLRPVPFPVYRDQTGGYDAAAWNALPKIYAVPEFREVSRELSRTRDHLYSVFSVDIYTTAESNPGEATANTLAQIVGDLYKLDSLIGYRPMDVATRRTAVYASSALPSDPGGPQAPGSAPEMTRRLAWQLLSWHQLNDLFLNGNITVPLDLRAQLGVKYVDSDFMYYVDGYTHDFPEGDQAPVTTYQVTRGLPVEMYGDAPRFRPPEPQWQDYLAKYLGRARPGETDRSGAPLGPVGARDVLASIEENTSS